MSASYCVAIITIIILGQNKKEYEKVFNKCVCGKNGADLFIGGKFLMLGLNVLKLIN